MSRILIVDDEKGIRFVFSEFLGKNGFETVQAENGEAALEAFKKERPDAVLLDYKMPGMDGLQTLGGLRKIDPSVPVIMITTKGDVPIAVTAMKTGAYDFLLKPPDFDSLVLAIRRAVEKSGLEADVKRLSSAVDASLECILGRGEAIRAVIAQITRVAQSDFSVIIQGETGTGKSMIAEVIHNLSKRRDRPFIRVDIGAISETIIESELFGHEKGAFTGADKAKKGFFEVSAGGTLFLDEIQNMPMGTQAKLLSAVEYKKVYPVGGTRQIDADVRIISAANADLRRLATEKRFREDLFFRLNEFTINIPPLRERLDEMRFLASRFLHEAASELQRPGMELTESALNLLMEHSWPGNIRELKNVMRRAALISTGTEIIPDHICGILGRRGLDRAAPMLPLKEISASATAEAEKAAIRQVLIFTKGNKSKAADILQVDYKTLLTKIKHYNITTNLTME